MLKIILVLQIEVVIDMGHGNAFNLFAPVVLLGPSGPWLR